MPKDVTAKADIMPNNLKNLWYDSAFIIPGHFTPLRPAFVKTSSIGNCTSLCSCGSCRIMWPWHITVAFLRYLLSQFLDVICSPIIIARNVRFGRNFRKPNIIACCSSEKIWYKNAGKICTSGPRNQGFVCGTKIKYTKVNVKYT